jgi:hypothetical protein
MCVGIPVLGDSHGVLACAAMAFLWRYYWLTYGTLAIGDHQVICYSSMIATCLTGLTIAYTGELGRAMTHAAAHPEVVKFSVISAIGGCVVPSRPTATLSRWCPNSVRCDNSGTGILL